MSICLKMCNCEHVMQITIVLFHMRQGGSSTSLMKIQLIESNFVRTTLITEM